MPTTDKIPITVQFNTGPITGFIRALDEGNPPKVYTVIIDNVWCGTLTWTESGWHHTHDMGIVDYLGDVVMLWHQ